MQQVEDRTSKSREHVEQPGVVCEHTQSPCELHYNSTPSYRIVALVQNTLRILEI